MKTLLLSVSAVLLSAAIFAQNGINYKALIKDNMGNIVANETITVELDILRDSFTVYEETHTPTTDVNGLIVLAIGEGTTSDTFSDINWGSNEHFLNVKIDIGSGLVDLGTTQFKTVPYAIIAQEAANVSGLEELDEGNGNGWRLKGKLASQHGDIGNDAVDLSHSTITSATMGATGAYSFAAGRDNIASGGNSVAIGVGNTASDYAAVAMGTANVASNFGAVALGNSNNASGDNSVALGRETTASSGSAVALGSATTATNIGSIAMGSATLASGRSATASGRFTRAQAYSGVALGRYNIGNGNSNSWVETDPLFEIGNGPDDTNRANALTVLKNGKVGVGNHQPSGYLEVKATNSTAQPHINLIHEGTQGPRITFSNTETTNGNRWTLYGDTNNTDANSVFNIFHPNAGNIVNIKGDGEVNINGDLNVSGNLITESGASSVGIGTSNPTEKLEVNGNIKSERIQLTTGANTGYVLTSNSDGLGFWTIPNDNDWTLDANNMFANISGNVGIGTTNPQSKLDVIGKVKAIELQLPVGATDGYVLTSDASGNATWEEASPNSGDDGDWTIIGSEVYRFGNVGIGTASPNSKLSVGGVGLSSASISGEIATASGYGVHGEYKGSGYGVGVYGRGGFGGNSESVGVYGRQIQGGTGVRGHTSGLTGIAIHGTRASTSGLAGKFEGPVEITGRLLVGPNPSLQAFQLVVDGTAAKSSGGSSWAVTSDRRLKDILGSYKKGLDEIEQLETIRFQYKADNLFNLQSETIEYGFVAQEVQKIFPEAVNEGTNGYLDFNMHVINVAMVNALQELNKEKNTLEQRVEKLERENNQLLALQKDLEILKAKDKALLKKLYKLELIEARLSAFETDSKKENDKSFAKQ